VKIILVLVHVLVCTALILIVLLQRGKGASMGAVFGGSSQAVFGSAGATSFLHKITTISAIVFMLTSLGLSFLMSTAPTSSVMEGVTQKEAPAAQESPAPSQAPATQEGK
jgi:preprotein translocase subunit SecG